MFRRRPHLPAFPPGGLLVGGAARDFLRGVTPKDFDWAVSDPRRAAELVAQQRRHRRVQLEVRVDSGRAALYGIAPGAVVEAVSTASALADDDTTATAVPSPAR